LSFHIAHFVLMAAVSNRIAPTGAPQRLEIDFRFPMAQSSARMLYT
jgi:hypothetical protein